MKIYVIDNGDVFEGTVDQFRDCFFSNASDRNVKMWCEKSGYTFKVKNVPKCEFCNGPIIDPNEVTYNKKNSKTAHRECFFKKYSGSRPTVVRRKIKHVITTITKLFTICK